LELGLKVFEFDLGLLGEDGAAQGSRKDQHHPALALRRAHTQFRSQASELGVSDLGLGFRLWIPDAVRGFQAVGVAVEPFFSPKP